MPRKYAVKIGDIDIISDTPITDAQREKAVQRIKRLGKILVFEEDGFAVWALVRV